MITNASTGAKTVLLVDDDPSTTGLYGNRLEQAARRTKERYGYLLHAYALMENHYPLFLETSKANISWSSISMYPMEDLREYLWTKKPT